MTSMSCSGSHIVSHERQMLSPRTDHQMGMPPSDRSCGSSSILSKQNKHVRHMHQYTVLEGAGTCCVGGMASCTMHPAAHLHQVAFRHCITMTQAQLDTWMLTQKLDVVVVAVAASCRSVCCMQRASCSVSVSFLRCASERMRCCRNAASPACLPVTWSRSLAYASP